MLVLGLIVMNVRLVCVCAYDGYETKYNDTVQAFGTQLPTLKFVSKSLIRFRGATHRGATCIACLM